MNSYVYFAFFSVMLSAVSQILLKESAQKKYNSKIHEYVNIYVVAGYVIVFICMALMVIAYKGMPLKIGIAIEPLTYFCTMVLCRLLLHEIITIKRLIGNVLIIIGIVIFSV